MQSASPIFREIEACRTCGSKELDYLFSLGDQYASGFSEAIQAPLTLVECADCSLVQLLHSVNRDILHRNYERPETTNITVAALRDVIDSAVKRYPSSIERRNVWVDIGAGDGSLLRQLPPNFIRIGFEPAKNLIRQDASMQIIPDYFTAARYNEILRQKVAVVSAVTMFPDLDQPRAFLREVREILDAEGVLVVQQNYLGSMLANNAYDQIGHTHLAYHSLTSMKHLLESEGLEVFDVEVNAVDGGSFRTFIGHKGHYPIAKSVAILLGHEQQTLTPEAYRNFISRIKRGRDQLCRFLIRCKRDGRRVYGYGASSRANTILQYCGIDEKLLAGIVSSEESMEAMRTAKPRYLLILPYYNLQHFIVHESAFLEHGGRFIIPLPEPRILERVAGELKPTHLPV